MSDDLQEIKDAIAKLEGQLPKERFDTESESRNIPVVSTTAEAVYRFRFVLGLTIIFGITILAALTGAVFCEDSAWTRLNAFLDVIIPAETGLLGLAAGHYFSRQKQ